MWYIVLIMAIMSGIMLGAVWGQKAPKRVSLRPITIKRIQTDAKLRERMWRDDEFNRYAYAQARLHGWDGSL